MQLEELVETYTTYLLKLSYLYVKDAQIAEDIVQEVFLKLHRIGCAHIEPNKAKSYIVQMTVNRCKDYLKSWHYKKMTVKHYFQDNGYERSDEVVQQEERSIIGAAVLQLPIKYREVIILHYFDEQTTAMISETLRIPIGTVKTRLIKARALLKPLLNDEYWEVLQHETRAR